jgi:hypothetical protein
MCKRFRCKLPPGILAFPLDSRQDTPDCRPNHARKCFRRASLENFPFLHHIFHIRLTEHHRCLHYSLVESFFFFLLLPMLVHAIALELRDETSFANRQPQLRSEKAFAAFSARRTSSRFALVFLFISALPLSRCSRRDDLIHASSLSAIMSLCVERHEIYRRFIAMTSSPLSDWKLT